MFGAPAHAPAHAFVLIAALIRAAGRAHPSHAGTILFLEFRINNMETFLVKNK